MSQTSELNERLGPISEINVEEAYEGFSYNIRKFLDAYNGSAKRAAELSGISYGYAKNLLMRNDIKAVLRSKIRNSDANRSMIATREERQLYWSRAMHDPNLSPAERMKASELLGKSYCDFSEKKVIEGGDNPIQHQIHVSVEERLKQLRKDREVNSIGGELDFLDE